jgi:CDP-diacylglycerol--glycerol-3-phosphate 3-phosphatidyltransferase
MKNIPFLLIFSRLVLGFVLLGSSLLAFPYYTGLAIGIIVYGLVSDIFDGIIARQLQVSTEKLRRLDSTIDQVFWICVLGATYVRCPDFFHQNYIQLLILIGIEGLAYVICYLKFKKEVATHAISSKVWALLIFATLSQVTISCDSGLIFQICFYVGIITRLEIIAIILVLKTWTNDVPSLYHAILLRQGKVIKRNKLFNG